MAENWYAIPCEQCGKELRIHADWDNPPKLCKDCKERLREHVVERAATTTNSIRDPQESNTPEIEVFVSYSHLDEKLRNELDKHLTTLRRNNMIRVWHDRHVGAGKEFEHEILHHLETAHLILLLISANFLASEYCYAKEMNRAMRRHAMGQARVIPIILRPADWHDTPFGKLNALPKDGKPVTTWTKRDLALLDIAKGIRDAVETLYQERKKQ